MVIGAFFSDAGTQLLEMISAFNPETDKLQNKLLIDFNWEKRILIHLKKKSKIKNTFLDIEQAYSCLVKEWLHYMEHLLENYPYLFFRAFETTPLVRMHRWK
ncbi:MAG: hypothetical protein KKF16_00680 [Euryarchaeota archaeon]|nr:hypothetical protein [Euryarchaeota archaeon]MBU4607068.1 hypothetical protein [Euryarchaeota archaeon]MBV1730356.1 hypothetical protein [Methanobacterium sp.]MBV1755177.1 hypothetical protein [Methanobacterium sp.]MBV1767102.1 hypothetical protein [Methanobacterium sp.]